MASNLSQNDAVKAEINDLAEAPQIVSTQGITEYRDNLAVSEVTTNAHEELVIGKHNPYPKDDVSNIARDYLVGRYSWAAASAVGSSVAVLSFPEDLISTSTFVTNRLSNYLWFRAGVHVTVRMNTTKYNYGSLLVSYIPFYDPDATGACRHLTLEQQVQNNGMILSANSDQVLEFDIPYLSPGLWMPLASTSNTNLGLIGSVFITVLNPLSSASPSPPSTVTVNVYARFNNPEVAGPAPENIISAFVPQSRPPRPRNEVEAAKKAQSNVLTDTIDGAITTIPKVVELASTVAGAIEKLAPLVALLLDKPGNLTVPQYIMNADSHDMTNVDGTDYSRKLSLHASAQASNDVESLTGVKHESIYDLVKRPGMFETFTFSSATSVDTTLLNVYNRPCVADHTLTGTHGYITPTPLSYYSAMFKYWRGSIKYSIHFNTSSFTTCRVRIVWYPGSGYDPAGLGGDYSGDVISRIVDITGDTWVDFTVPYLYPAYYQRCAWCESDSNAQDYVGQLNISLVNPVVTPDTNGTTSVYATLFHAAGEDFRLMNYVGFRFPQSVTGASFTTTNALPSADVFTPQTSIGVKFKQPFEGLINSKYNVVENIMTEDPVTTLEDIGKIYVNCTISANNNTAGTDVAHATTFPQYTLYYGHLFWRGSLRLKQQYSAGQYALLANYATSIAGSLQDGMKPSVVTNVPRVFSGTGWNTQIATAEIPYFSKFAWQETMPAHNGGWLDSPEYYQYNPTGNPDNEWSAFGDDYCLIYPAALPIMYWDDPTLSAKVKAPQKGTKTGTK